MRKEERLLQLLGEVSDEYIIEAETVDNHYKFAQLKKRKVTKLDWYRWGAVAAMAAITFGVSGVYLKPEIDDFVFDPSLPKIVMEEINEEGMGSGGLMGFRIDDILTANPWFDNKVKSLPVFENVHHHENTRLSQEEKLIEMKVIHKEIAERFGLQLKDEDLRMEIITPEYYYISYENEAYTLSTSNDYVTTVILNSDNTIPENLWSRELPIEIQGNSVIYPTLRETRKLSDYYLNEYAHLIRMDNAGSTVEGGDYNIYEKRSYNTFYFEKSDDPVETILNYNFRKVELYNLDSKVLSSVRFYQKDLTHVIGAYPLITEREAKRLLVEGYYHTSVPEKFPGSRYIRRVELVYRTGMQEKIYMPYYRILVEMPNLKYERLNTYAAFYVPAVRGEYLENMPVNDGSFN